MEDRCMCICVVFVAAAVDDSGGGVILRSFFYPEEANLALQGQ